MEGAPGMLGVGRFPSFSRSLFLRQLFQGQPLAGTAVCGWRSCCSLRALVFPGNLASPCGRASSRHLPSWLLQSLADLVPSQWGPSSDKCAFSTKLSSGLAWLHVPGERLGEQWPGSSDLRCQQAQGQARSNVCPCLAPGLLSWLLWPPRWACGERAVHGGCEAAVPSPHPHLALYLKSRDFSKSHVTHRPLNCTLYFGQQRTVGEHLA